MSRIVVEVDNLLPVLWHKVWIREICISAHFMNTLSIGMSD